MELIEKVIKGLECCLPMTTKDGQADCKSCPYDRPITLKGGVCECCHELMSDALTLLKAQEAEAVDASKPDSDIGCWYDITHNYTLEQVVSALKAQEPRVMTSSEVMDYIGYFEKNPPSRATKLPLWTESKKETGVFSGYRDIGNIRNLIHMSGLDRSYIFNQHWRCWTAHPTIEQMNNTPWEERDNGEKADY